MFSSSHFTAETSFSSLAAPDPAHPACCLLLTAECFSDYLLYGGPAVGQALLTELTAFLRDRLPTAPITPFPDGSLLCFWEGGTPREARKLGILLREKQSAFSLPSHLPSYLRPPRFRLIAAFSPPLPRSLLIWRMLLAKEEHTPFFPEKDPLRWLAARSESRAQAAAKGAKLAEILLSTAGAAATQLEDLRQAALWADMGMGCLPSCLLLSPLPLTLAEKEQLRQHVDFSERLAAAAHLTPAAQKLIALHHERVDGSGYPRGLGGADLPPAAQLLHLIHDYASLQTDFPWRQSLRPAAALLRTEQWVGKKYNAATYRFFCRLLKESTARKKFSQKHF